MINILKYKILLIAYFIIGFFEFTAYAQNQQRADSLIMVLEEAANNDSVDYSLCLQISRNSANPSQMLFYANKALQLANKMNNDNWKGASHSAIGHACRLKGELVKSIDAYFKALKFYQDEEYKIGIAACYSNLGGVYQAQQDYQKSILYYNRAIEVFKDEQDSVKLATSLLNIGESYRLIEANERAFKFFEASESIFNLLNYPIGKAYCLGNIGLVHAEQGRHELAEKNMNQAISILEELGDYYPIAVYQTSLAEIYAQRGELKRAVEYAKSSLRIGMEEGLKEQIRDASLKLSELYKSSGNSDQAYNYLKQYIAYRDSINNEETIRKMADLRTEYEVARKQTELDLLGDQARLNRIVSWSAIFIIALLLILTLALLKIYRIKDRAVRIVRQRRRVIAAQRNQLDEVNKTKDRFFSIISHDIRGPVSNFQGISGLINMLAESKDVDGLKQLGQMMESSAKEVSVLLDNLLEWALSQEGKIPYSPEPLDLNELCRTNLSIMANMAAAKKIETKVDLEQQVNIEADKNSVSTIIRNLLSNALKFTNEGGKVELKLEEQDGQGVIVVKDSGIGIPKDKLDDIFSFKGKRSRGGTKGEKGIGLGLSLVQEFVALNNGRVEVDSEEGVGTTFKVYLPVGSR